MFGSRANNAEELNAYKREIQELKQECELYKVIAGFSYDEAVIAIRDNEVIFKKVPQLISKVSPKEILTDILANLSGDINNIEEQIIITTACKAAVKANTYLNNFQMLEIVKNWRKCEKPFTCPHGRPISKIIEHKDIAKFFQRTK